MFQEEGWRGLLKGLRGLVHFYIGPVQRAFAQHADKAIVLGALERIFVGVDQTVFNIGAFGFGGWAKFQAIFHVKVGQAVGIEIETDAAQGFL